MEQVLCLKDFKIASDMQLVMNLLHCQEDSPVYEEMKEAYAELVLEAEALAQPVALLYFSTMQPEIATEHYPVGTPVLYVITSIGKPLSQLSGQYFSKGDAVKGMLADAIADACLFSFGGSLQEIIKAECKKRNVGIAKNLQAPVDISMEAQRVAHRLTKAEELAGIGITSGLMLDPVKSGCTLYVLTEDETCWRTEHDCRKCPRTDCMMRRLPPVSVTVIKGNQKKEIEVTNGQSLLDALVSQHVFLQSPCGGTGKCGKCKVTVVEGELPASPQDVALLTTKELESGVRLACCAYPQADCTILLQEDGEYEAIATYAGADKKESTTETTYGIAVDIGTTTIALALVGLNSGATIETVSLQNHQSAYGADVISRIQAANNGKLWELQNVVHTDLKNGIAALLQKASVAESSIEKIVIAANTTMVHLLLGYSCETLGVAPFTPVNLGPVFDEKAWIFPGVSTFVGGDIVSGLLACDFDKLEQPALFLDLGTNGEIALGDKNGIVVASTAAGPAFEGGNLSCGVGSVEGAVCSVVLDGGKVKSLTTIRSGIPCGICGTGVVELVAELLREGILDETGLLNDDYFEEGFSIAEGTGGIVKLTQKDIREVQLAKAAIRAGVETLMAECHVSSEQLQAVYVAGGFGYQLNIEKAIRIGLLPEEFAGKVVAVGNGSLAGAVLCLQQEENRKRAVKLRDSAKEVSLSEHKIFQELYIESMMFE